MVILSLKLRSSEMKEIWGILSNGEFIWTRAFRFKGLAGGLGRAFGAFN